MARFGNEEDLTSKLKDGVNKVKQYASEHHVGERAYDAARTAGRYARTAASELEENAKKYAGYNKEVKKELVKGGLGFGAIAVGACFIPLVPAWLTIAAVGVPYAGYKVIKAVAKIGPEK